MVTGQVSATAGQDAGWFLAELARTRVFAILRAPDAMTLVEPALALFDAGVGLVEVSLTSTGACAAIAEIAGRAPRGCRVGAGTVLTMADVADVRTAGAQFVVTPAMADSVPEAVRRGLPVAAGALTPSEALAAHRAGAAAVKLFPASLGGPPYLKALRDPFPDIPFLAVGGVGADDTPAFLAAGAVAVGVGSPLLGDFARDGDLDALRGRAEQYLRVARGDRP